MNQKEAQQVILKDLFVQLSATERKIRYSVNKLIEIGYIKTHDSSIKLLSVTDKGKAYLESLLGDLQKDTSYVSPFLDRAHKIHIKQPIFERPRDIIPEGFTANDQSVKLNWKFPKLTRNQSEKNLTILITDTSVNYYFGERYGLNPHQLILHCINDCFGYAKVLQREGFKLDLPNTAIIQQSHAISSEHLAKFTSRYKIHYNSDRLTFDASVKNNEFELTHPEHAGDDFLRMTDFLEAVVRGKITLNDLTELSQLLPSLKMMLQNNQLDAKTVTETVKPNGVISNNEPADKTVTHND